MAKVDDYIFQIVLQDALDNRETLRRDIWKSRTPQSELDTMKASISDGLEKVIRYLRSVQEEVNGLQMMSEVKDDH